MIEVVVFGEGLTEETFVRDVLAPALLGLNISLQPRLVRTSLTGRGGALTRNLVVKALRNTLRQRVDTYVTTLFDLYGLREDFPGVSEHIGLIDPRTRAAGIETRLAEIVVQEAECRADRFLPHIQPYEFESLLFTDIGQAADLEPSWRDGVAALAGALSMVESPEHINDGPTTHPSARMATLDNPRYRKLLHGPLIAERIGLDRIRAQCGHFADWLYRLEHLAPLS